MAWRRPCSAGSTGSAIPGGTRARRIGLWHGLGNVVVLALFGSSWVLRRENPVLPPTAAIIAGLMGVVLMAITAWLGGELVDRLGVGVDEGAHLDSPSSLSGLPAGAGLGASARASYAGPERRKVRGGAYAGVDRRATVAWSHPRPFPSGQRLFPGPG